MLKKCLSFCVIALFATTTYAKTSTINPMSPRQISSVSYDADKSYGYSLLAGSAIDSLERINRGGFYLNYDIFDKYMLRPVAHGYAALPNFVQCGVGNFLSNIDDVTSTIDNIFVLRFKDSFISFARVILNTTIGLGGLFDVAKDMGIDRKPMTMSTVFGIWGQEQGPFLMIPVYGPTSGRALQGNSIDGAPFFIAPWYINAGLFVLNGIHSRAALIEQEGLVDNALDPYIQTRDFYLMYQQGKVQKALGVGPHLDEDKNIDDSLLDEIDG